MRFTLLFLLVALVSCTSRVITGNELSNDTKEYIKHLGILNDNEDILYYYSSLTKEISGNFITPLRVATYWQNADPQQDFIKSALYREIDSIGIIYGDGFEFTSALVIHLKKNKKFEVCFNDKKEKIDEIHAKAEEFLLKSRK